MTVGVSLPDAPAPISERRLFTSNGVDFTVADLARRAGVGSRESLLPTPTPSARQAEEGFRRSRGLLTADKLQAWLADWQIAPEDFRRWTEDAAAGTSTATGWCALHCSGELDVITAVVASAAAAACELGSGPRFAADFDPADWTERLVARDTTAESLGAVIAAHRLDWTWLETVSVITDTRGVAEELRHQVHSDGAELSAAANSADCTVRTDTGVLAAITPPGLRTVLAGARIGDLVGPVSTTGGWALVSVRNRTNPTLADPPTRARAEAAVRNDVISRAVARHVVA
jgi:hypothetical protein